MSHIEMDTGFSISYALLGFIVCLSKKKILDAAIGFTITLLTAGIGQIVIAFFYNHFAIQKRAADGYVPANNAAKAYFKKHDMGYVPIDDILKERELKAILQH